MLAQDAKLATRVGAVVLLLLAAAIAFFIFIAGKLEFGERVRVHVFFKHTGELREGAPVIVGGNIIMKQISVRAAGAAAPAPAKLPTTGGEDAPVGLLLAAFGLLLAGALLTLRPRRA